MLTFGPDGLTGHHDHRTVSAWTGAAFDRAAARVPVAARHAAERRARWGALTDSLGIYPPGLPVLTPAEGLALDLELDPDVARRKVRALAAQQTQTAGLIATLGADVYTAWVGDESFVEAARPVTATSAGGAPRLRLRAMACRATSRTAARW